jgi:hypothetical protein
VVRQATWPKLFAARVWNVAMRRENWRQILRPAKGVRGRALPVGEAKIVGLLGRAATVVPPAAPSK